MKLRFAFAALLLASTTPAFSATLVTESGTVSTPALSAFRAAGSKPFGGYIAKNLPAPIQVPTAVPEPETWAMLLMGFGVLGAMARRRPHPRVVAA